MYLALWGLNRVVYLNQPQNQQHPEDLVDFFRPRPVPVLRPRRWAARPPAHRAHPISPLPGVRYQGHPDWLNVGVLRATVYHAVAGQTDASPLETADDSRIDPRRTTALRWCGISRGLHRRWGGPLGFGDTLLVTDAGRLSGRWVVRDLMNRRHRNRIDFLVDPGAGHDADQGTVRVCRIWKSTGHKTKS